MFENGKIAIFTSSLSKQNIVMVSIPHCCYAKLRSVTSSHLIVFIQAFIIDMVEAVYYMMAFIHLDFFFSKIDIIPNN